MPAVEQHRPEELVLYSMAECMAGEVTGEVKLDLWNAAVPALPVSARDESANSTDARPVARQRSPPLLRGATLASSTSSIASPAVTRRWSRLRQHGRPPLRGRREFKVPNALIRPWS